MNARRRFVPLVLLLLVGFALGGCTKKMIILQVPRFYDASLRSIAVVPFRSPTDKGVAGRIIADQLAAALQANGTYTVYNRNDLKTLIDERDLSAATSDDPLMAAQTLQKLGKVQAVLTGSVNTYAAKSLKQPRREPIYRYDKRTGNQYVVGYRSYEYIFNSGTVSVTGALIRLSDGETIFSTPVPVSANRSCNAERPRYSDVECLTVATREVVGRLVEEFAVVRKQVKLNIRKALRTASGLYDDKWTHADKFNADATEMIVVVNLPTSCDRNRFRLVIVRGRQQDVLVAKEFTWSRSNPSRGIGFEFSPREIARKGGGPGRYTVKFYNGPTPILSHGFRIVR
jgi:hypothetical protein